MTKKVLILAPHADDGELGCGGTIARLAEEGDEVHYLVFCYQAGGIRGNELKEEHQKAIKILGVAPENVRYLNLIDKELEFYRHYILEVLDETRDALKPDLVIAPSSFDVHQDHGAIHKESLRCFKETAVLGMETIWNNFSFATTAFFKLERRHIEKKVQAVLCFQSQKNDPYINKEFLFGLAKARGVQIRAPYAEAFEVIRMIL